MIIVPIITITFHQVTCRQVSEAIWSRALSTNWSGSRWRWPWGKFLIISSANIITSSFYHYPSEGGLLCFSIIIAMLKWVKIYTFAYDGPDWKILFLIPPLSSPPSTSSTLLSTNIPDFEAADTGMVTSWGLSLTWPPGLVLLGREA